MTASGWQVLGMVTACGAAGTALLARDPRWRYAAIWVALTVAPALVAGDVWHQARFADLRAHPALLVLVLGAVAAAVALLALAFDRFGDLFPVLAFAFLPLRLPVQVGGETSDLLVPLYWVIAAAAARGAYRALRPSATPLRVPERPRRRTVVWLLRLLAATLVLYAIQSAYSEDISNAIENAGFFLVPFSVLLVLLLEVDWTPRLLGLVLAAVSAAALLFAAVAFWEYLARDLLFNTQLLDANQIHTYFRVNSLFHDPNVLGRYLALTVVALAAYVACEPHPKLAVAATAVAGVSLVALALTYSLTSIAALLAGLLVVAWLRWGAGVAAGVGVALVVGAGIYVLVSNTEQEFRSGRKANQALEGRVDLVQGGIDLARDRPAWGWGSGSFGASFQRHIERAKTTTSHSEPITVAAEQGGIGLAVYLALLSVALAVLLAGASGSVARMAAAGCFVAMVVHSLGYASFVIDPAMWALLALGIAIPLGTGARTEGG